jgi:predicted alpha/beta-fold hydrolase
MGCVRQQKTYLKSLFLSTGGLKLAGYLSKNSENPHVSNAMIVSVPFNTSVTIEEIQKPHNLLINKAITRKLIQIAERYFVLKPTVLRLLPLVLLKSMHSISIN